MFSPLGTYLLLWTRHVLQLREIVGYPKVTVTMSHGLNDRSKLSPIPVLRNACRSARPVSLVHNRFIRETRPHNYRRPVLLYINGTNYVKAIYFICISVHYYNVSFIFDYQFDSLFIVLNDVANLYSRMIRKRRKYFLPDNIGSVYYQNFYFSPIFQFAALFFNHPSAVKIHTLSLRTIIGEIA